MNKILKIITILLILLGIANHAKAGSLDKGFEALQIHDYFKAKAVFYKAFTNFKTVKVLEGQGSDILKSFALANCFVYVKSNITSIKKNEIVKVHLISNV